MPIEVSARVRNLPPYLFGKINDLKSESAGPATTSSTWAWATRPTRPSSGSSTSSARPPATPGTTATASPRGSYNLRREVAKRYESRFGVALDPDHEIVATIGSKEGFSHMCLALLGPGDTALAPAPTFPIHAHAVALAEANVIALDVRDPQAFLANVAEICENLYPRPKVLVLNFPHNPTATVVEPGLLRGGRRPGPTLPLLRDPRLRLRRHRLRRLRAAELPGGQGGQGRRLRVHDDVQGLQHGRLAGRLRRRQPGRCSPP